MEVLIEMDGAGNETAQYAWSVLDNRIDVIVRKLTVVPISNTG